MTLALLFWILMLLWLIFGGLERFGPTGPYWGWGGFLLMFILFLLGSTWPGTGTPRPMRCNATLVDRVCREATGPVASGQAIYQIRYHQSQSGNEAER